MRHRFLSIGVKLAGSTALLVVILAGCLYVTLVRHEESRLRGSGDAGAAMLARLFVAMASAPVTFSDEKGAQELVALLATNQDVVQASLWSVSESPGALRRPLAALDRGASVAAPTGGTTDLTLRRDDLFLVAEAPVLDPSGKVVGIAQLTISLAREREALARMARRILALSIVASVIVTTLLLLLARRMILQPVARLASAAHAMERGEEPDLVIAANDEIGRLATAFMSMSNAIDEREKRLAERAADMRRLLDNVEEGFLAVGPTGIMSQERSRIVEIWFGAPGPEQTVFDYLATIGGDDLGQRMRTGWEALTDGILPIELCVDQLPKRLDRGGRTYSVGYRPVLEGETLGGVLIVICDDTERIALDRIKEAQAETMAIFQHMLADRAAFDEYMRDTTDRMASLEHPEELDAVTLRRQLHTLKGNSAMFGMEAIARACHDLETRLIGEERERPSPAEARFLRAAVERIVVTYSQLKEGTRSAVHVDEYDCKELLREIDAGAARARLASVIASWRLERATGRMVSLGQQARQVARRLGKSDVQVEITQTHLRLHRRSGRHFGRCSRISFATQSTTGSKAQSCARRAQNPSAGSCACHSMKTSRVGRFSSASAMTAGGSTGNGWP